MPRAERSFRTPGIILKRHNYAEADRVLTILTPKHGKLSVIAKGARKPTSTKTGHVELFTVVDMLVSRGRTFDILTQVEVQQPFLPLREDIQRGAYASYAAELMDRFATLGDDDFSQAFTLLTETFDRLCSDGDSRLVTRYYELNLLSLSGFQPQLNHCVMTGDEIQPQDQFFSFAEGGVVSPQGAQHGSALSPPLTARFEAVAPYAAQPVFTGTGSSSYIRHPSGIRTADARFHHLYSGKPSTKRGFHPQDTRTVIK